ncbi:gag/pol protein [Cucumis melo var. makuwa]|uniref:Gag/pol protein n=1 Tax=Cucumis melo var. makuwa TaxID=1194695 RepID=A0A5D3BXB1_CUCMM|nr:gag/pol protein [Cucumis melo var. makuwa]
MMTKLILHKLFVILAGSKYRFTSEITSCSLRSTDPLLNNWFKIEPINLNPSRANQKVGPLVQNLDSVLKGTTYLLSQKWVGENFIVHPLSIACHSVLSLKWKENNSWKNFSDGEITLKVGTGEMVSAKAVGDLKLFFNDRYIILKNVLYAPQMKRNLISESLNGMTLLITLYPNPSLNVCSSSPKIQEVFANTRGHPLHSMLTPAQAGILKSPFPPGSWHNCPDCSSGNSYIP